MRILKNSLCAADVPLCDKQFTSLITISVHLNGTKIKVMAKEKKDDSLNGWAVRVGDGVARSRSRLIQQ